MPYTIASITCLDEQVLNELSEVLLDVVAGGASVGFIEPMTQEKALRYWQAVGESLARQERLIWVAYDDAQHLVGTVTVVVNLPENQPHRGDLIKLLVHRRMRNQGIGEALMRAAEQGAVQAGKSLLVLDTTGGAAGRLYERLQWQKVGSIPNYAMFPDQRLSETTYYYKLL